MDPITTHQAAMSRIDELHRQAEQVRQRRAVRRRTPRRWTALRRGLPNALRRVLPQPARPARRPAHGETGA